MEDVNLMSSVTIPPDDLLMWDESKLIEALTSIKNIPKGRSALGEINTSGSQHTGFLKSGVLIPTVTKIYQVKLSPICI